MHVSTRVAISLPMPAGNVFLVDVEAKTSGEGPRCFVGFMTWSRLLSADVFDNQLIQLGNVLPNESLTRAIC